MTKKIEVIIIEEDVHVVHRSVSNVYEDSNTYNVAIQAIVEALTGTKPMSAVQSGTIPLTKSKTRDKFAEAVPGYKEPQGELQKPSSTANQGAFHPDLIAQGVVPKAVIENGIQTVKLDMKSILRNT